MATDLGSVNAYNLAFDTPGSKRSNFAGAGPSLSVLWSDKDLPCFDESPGETEGEADGVWILTSPTNRLRPAGFQPAGISADGVALPEPRTQNSVIPTVKTLTGSEYAE
jgi:hypothetical protein